MRCDPNPEQFPEIGVRCGQVFDKQSVFGGGSFACGDNQVLAIIGDGCADIAVRFVGTLIDQGVVVLWIAQTMVVNLLTLRDLLILYLFLRLRVSTVEKAFAIRSPCHRSELAPADQVGQIFAAFHVPDAPFLPVRPGGRYTIRGIFAILAHGEPGKRHRTIGRKFIWIDQDTTGFPVIVRDIPDILVLQAIVSAVKVASAFLKRGGSLLIIPEFGQSRFE